MSNPSIHPLPPGSTPCRFLLAAVYDALNLPYPATDADVRSFYILRSKRAGLVLEAAERILTDRDAGDDDMIAAADILIGQCGDYPPDTYQHNPLPS